MHSGHYHHNFNIPIFIVVLMFLGNKVAQHFLPENTKSNPEESIPKIRPCVFWFDFACRAFPWVLSVLFVTTGVFIQYFSYVNDAPQASEDQRYMAALSWLEVHTSKESVVMANEKLSNLIPIFTSNNVVWASLAPNYLVSLSRARFTPENLLHSKDFLRDIKQYRVDYILWDKRTDPTWNIDRFTLPILFSSSDLVIYKLP
jgi:hypothetical protein